MRERTINPAGNPRITSYKTGAKRYTRDDFIRDLKRKPGGGKRPHRQPGTQT